MAWSVSFLANKNVLCGLWWCLYTLNLFRHWRERKSSGKDPEGFSWGSVSIAGCVNSGQRQEVIFCEYVCFCLPVQESSIPGSGRSPGVGNGNLLQYSRLENSTDRGPGEIQSIELQRIRQDWSDLAWHVWVNNTKQSNAEYLISLQVSWVYFISVY